MAYVKKKWPCQKVNLNFWFHIYILIVYKFTPGIFGQNLRQDESLLPIPLHHLWTLNLGILILMQGEKTEKKQL